MINLYIDFDGVIKDTISVSYKMMADTGINMKNKAEIIKFYQDIDWVALLDKSDELNKAFQWIDKIIEEGIFRPAVLTTVNSLGEMIAKTNYVRSKNNQISIICVPSGIEKNKVVNAFNAILVDDYSGNLLNWSKAGGISIKYGYDKDYVSINSLDYFVSNGISKKLELALQ